MTVLTMVRKQALLINPEDRDRCEQEGLSKAYRATDGTILPKERRAKISANKKRKGVLFDNALARGKNKDYKIAGNVLLSQSTRKDKSNNHNKLATAKSIARNQKKSAKFKKVKFDNVRNGGLGNKSNTPDYKKEAIAMKADRVNKVKANLSASQSARGARSAANERAAARAQRAASQPGAIARSNKQIAKEQKLRKALGVNQPTSRAAKKRMRKEAIARQTTRNENAVKAGRKLAQR